MQFLCQLRICIYQSNKIRIILCSRSSPQLRHDDLKCLTNTIIPPHALCSSLQAITERHYIYQETNRRFRIIKISRISALTIIPFMMPHCRIMENLQTGNCSQEDFSQPWMQSDYVKFIISQRQIFIVYDRHYSIFSYIMHFTCTEYERAQSTFMFQYLLCVLVSENTFEQFRLISQDTIQQHLSYFGNVNRMGIGGYLSRDIQTTHKPDHLLITKILHQPSVCR